MASANVLTQPRSGVEPLIAASILSADFARMGEECKAVLHAGADLLHLDVMDGRFVPNLTMGPAMCRSLRRAFPGTCLDVHMMVTSPEMFVRPFADAGASNFTFHIEAAQDPAELARLVRAAGMTAGLALNPPTPVDELLPLVDHFDLILIMSVNPGFSGQEFMPAVLAKARTVRPLLRPNQRLEIDGGVSPRTAKDCVSAGCDVLVAASAVFGSPDYRGVIAELRSIPDIDSKQRQGRVPRPS